MNSLPVPGSATTGKGESRVVRVHGFLCGLTDCLAPINLTKSVPASSYDASKLFSFEDSGKRSRRHYSGFALAAIRLASERRFVWALHLDPFWQQQGRCDMVMNLAGFPQP